MEIGIALPAQAAGVSRRDTLDRAGRSGRHALDSLPLAKEVATFQRLQTTT